MNNDIVIIKLDRERQIKFTHTAQKTLCALTGKTIEEIDSSMDLTDFELLETLVYCGLLYDAKKREEVVDRERLPELLDEAPSQAHVWGKLVEAWRIAFGAPERAEQARQAEGNSQAPGESGGRSTGKKVSA